MELLEIDADRLTEYSADVLSEVFSFEDMEYFAGIKLFNTHCRTWNMQEN